MDSKPARHMDEAISPSHYQFRATVTLDDGTKVSATIETKDYIKAVCRTLEGDEAWAVSNILKYISRYRTKHKENVKRDINKAIEYTDFLIEILKEKGGINDER